MCEQYKFLKFTFMHLHVELLDKEFSLVSPHSSEQIERPISTFGCALYHLCQLFIIFVIYIVVFPPGSGTQEGWDSMTMSCDSVIPQEAGKMTSPSSVSLWMESMVR